MLTRFTQQKIDRLLYLHAQAESDYRNAKWRSNYGRFSELEGRVRFYLALIKKVATNANLPMPDTDSVAVCDVTGEYYQDSSDFYHTDCGLFICEDEFGDNWFVCDHDCESITHKDDMCVVFKLNRYDNPEELFVSQDNRDRFYTYCIDGNYWHDSDVTRDEGEYIPNILFHNGVYRHCDSCEAVIHEDDTYHDDYDSLCRHCFNERHDEEEEEEEELINEYNYKHPLTFFGDATFHLGYEWEMDTSISGRRVTIAEGIRSIMDSRVSIKNDGSLSSRGIEVVSQPMSYEYTMENKSLIKTMFDYAVSQGYRSHNTDTCGIHIHISRSAFVNEEAQARFVFLFEKFYEEVYKFSRRTRGEYERWARSYQIYDTKDTAQRFKSKLDDTTKQKYRIVNMCHRDTLEVRAFRGTLNVDTFIASVQLIMLMRQLANHADNVVEGTTWQTLVRLARLKGYSEFIQYLDKRGMLSLKTPRYQVVKNLGRRTIQINEMFEVVGNSSSCEHFLEIGDVVRLAGLSNSYNALCVHSEAYGGTQYVSTSNLRPIDSPEGVTLSNFDYELTI